MYINSNYSKILIISSAILNFLIFEQKIYQNNEIVKEDSKMNIVGIDR